MKKNEAIEIVPTQNGWIVKPVVNYRSGEMQPLSECKVFQTMNELRQFIVKHFDYRCEESILDD